MYKKIEYIYIICSINLRIHSETTIVSKKMPFALVTAEYALSEIRKHGVLSTGMSAKEKYAVLGFFTEAHENKMSLSVMISKLVNLTNKANLPLGRTYIRDALAPRPDIVMALIDLSIQQCTVEQAICVVGFLPTTEECRKTHL